MREFCIDNHKIGFEHPTYFVADIGANHDGDIERAKELIYLCKDSGVDAIKFQHFSADTIVSDYGFKSLGDTFSHQKKWKKSVYEVYKDASINLDWTPTLKEECNKAGITLLTSPYSFELVDFVEPYIPAFKIGSGDITWLEIMEHIARKGKPVLLATGASDIQDVKIAMDSLLKITDKIVLMQCNTNYTGSLENFKYINLNVLKTYHQLYPEVILGLSDHTPGHSTVLGAVTLGARVIEKHFTDNNNRIGPDHPFSMTPKTWKEMVERTRELEFALGDIEKNVTENEKETVILQRRSLRVKTDLASGHVIGHQDLKPLRPCPKDAISPSQMNTILGKTVKHGIKSGDYLRWTDLV